MYCKKRLPYKGRKSKKKSGQAYYRLNLKVMPNFHKTSYLLGERGGGAFALCFPEIGACSQLININEMNQFR